MLEDALLILRFRYGSAEALGRIYEKYRHYLLIYWLDEMH